MQNNASLQKWSQKSVQYWNVLTQGATWIFSIIGGFLLPPIGVLTTDEKSWMRLASLVTTALFGLAFVGCLKFKLKKHQKLWWLGSVILLLLSISLFLAYQRISYSWTCEYNYHRVLVGSEYTEQAARFIEKYGQQSCEFLLKSNAGEVGGIWTKESISTRRITLGGMYIGCVSLFTICIIGVIQAIFIATRRSSSYKSAGDTKTLFEAQPVAKKKALMKAIKKS